MVVMGAIMCGAFGTASQPVWAAITVDGLLSDWGVNPGPYSAGPSQWTPNTGIAFVQEDQNPAVSFLNPGFGGQQFDVEAIYFTQQNSTAYFALVSGLPLRKVDTYPSGDFAIDFGSNGSYEFGVKTTGTHTLYGNTTWSAPNLFPVSTPFAITSGTALGVVPFGYQESAYTANGHYAFEIGVPTSLFSSYWPTSGTLDMTLHWTMSCGNDALDLHVRQLVTPPPTTPVIPEPSDLLLFSFGLQGLTGVRRLPRISRLTSRPTLR